MAPKITKAKTKLKKVAKREPIFVVPTLAELYQIRPVILDINKLHRSSLSKLDKVAVWVTGNVGTMGFFSLIFLWTIAWLSWNTLAPVDSRFDPFPAFVLWIFISNLIQLLLLPLIMIGQNLQGKHTERRTESDYAVNIRSQKEIYAILARLELQDKLLAKILKKLEKK